VPIEEEEEEEEEDYFTRMINPHILFHSVDQSPYNISHDKFP